VSAVKDPLRRKLTLIIDLEKLNTLNAEGCPACGQKFTLGEIAVLASGPWEGAARVVHESDAVWDPKTNTFLERKFYESRNPRS
jgi:hypothetical protein